MQSPLQPWKIPLPAGICDRVTTVLVVKVTLHTPVVMPSFTVQLIPAGALVITPPPRDPAVGATTNVAGIDAAANPAPTGVVVPETTVAVHAVPAHAPVNPLNALLPVLTAFSVTFSPPANTAAQVPFTLPAVMVQLMPSGRLVTVPAPVPKPPTDSVPGADGMR